MNNNVFYKALAAVITVGIVVIAGIQVTTALKKGNNAEDQLAKTIVEIKNTRKIRAVIKDGFYMNRKFLDSIIE